MANKNKNKSNTSNVQDILSSLSSATNMNNVVASTPVAAKPAQPGVEDYKVAAYNAMSDKEKAEKTALAQQMLNDGKSVIASEWLNFVNGQNQTTPTTGTQPETTTTTPTGYSSAGSALDSYMAGYQKIIDNYNEQIQKAKEESAARYAALKNQYYEGVDKTLAARTDTANANAKKQLTEAYIQKLQTQRSLADTLARAGIRGGATESSAINLENAYGGSRNTINANRDQLIKEYNLAADQDKLTYGLDIDTQETNYLQNLGSEQRQANREDATNMNNTSYDNAMTQAQWEREDALTEKQWAREDTVRQLEYEREDQLRAEDLKNTAKQTYWQGKADSMKTVKGCQTAIDNLKKKLKKGDISKSTYNMAVGLLNSRIKEIRESK